MNLKKISLLTGLSAAAVIGSSALLPANAITYQFSGGTGAFVDGGSISGSFDFNGTTYSNINISVTNGSNPSFSNFTYTSLNSSINTASLKGLPSASFLPIVTNTSTSTTGRYLELQFSSALTGSPLNSTTLFYPAVLNQGEPSNEIAVFSSSPSYRGVFSTVTVTAVPFETDVLPILGATLAFGGGMFAKKKLAEKKIKNLAMETANSQPTTIDA